MSLEQLPSLHTGLGVNGHAHPSPTAATMSASGTEEERLEELLAGLVFDVELRGLAFSSHAAPQAMHLPRLRKSKSLFQTVSHLDDISCWKGISNAQALEIVLWERLFQQCLAKYIEERLHRSIIVQMRKHSEYVDEFTLVPFLLRLIPKEHARFININVHNLIGDMIDAFYEDHPSKTAARDFRWSLGSQDLPSFVYNFLCIHDCFRETLAGPCLYVKCTLDWSKYPCLSTVAHVAWQPPDVRFHNVPAQIAPRGQFVIAPCHVPVLGGLQTACYKHYPGNIFYTVTKSLSTIQWDHKDHIFRAQAPDNTEGTCPQVPEIVIEARTVVEFPESVRFERVSRYAIKISVATSTQRTTTLDQHVSQANTPKKRWAHSYANSPVSKTRPHGIGPRKWINSPLDNSVNEHQSMAADKDLKDVNPVTIPPIIEIITSAGSVATVSPKKRKSSLSDAAILAIDTATDKMEASFKRQKLEGSEDGRSDTSTLSAGHEPVEPHPTLAVVPQMTQRSSPKNHEEKELPTKLSYRTENINDILQRYRIIHDPASFLPKDRPSKTANNETITVASARYTTPPRRCPTPPFSTASPQVSPRTVSLTAAIGPSPRKPLRLPSSPTYSQSNKRVDSCHFQSLATADLSQRQIQSNYREFEEWAMRKKTRGLGDVGDLQFERIFLGDSEEEWGSWGEDADADADADDDVDGLSEDISGLDLEI